MVREIRRAKINPKSSLGATNTFPHKKKSYGVKFGDLGGHLHHHQQVHVQVVSNGRVEIWWRPILLEDKIIKILFPWDRSHKVRSAG